MHWMPKKEDDIATTEEFIKEQMNSKINEILAKDTDKEIDMSNLIDQVALNKIRAMQRPDKPDILKKILNLYLEKTPELINEAQSSLDENKIEEFTRAAHSLKSTSATLGVADMARSCKDLETMGRENNVVEAPQLITDIQSHFDKVRVEIETMVA